MSNDGQVRLLYHVFERAPLVHLISGVDEDAPPIAAEAAVPLPITGYTEWVSEGKPVITLGWDWLMLAATSRVQLRRIGEPRSNLMLQDAGNVDLGHAKTSLLLEMFIDNLNWQEAALRHLESRY